MHASPSCAGTCPLEPAGRNTHPYILVDRLEDTTSEEAVRKDAWCDRKVVLYGCELLNVLLPPSLVTI
eukprot:SAG11_NODE_307_length_10982_cov_22.068823_12_plen_68_part_00